MANIRILELAKELNVDVAKLQEAAVSCGVAVTGPTSMLNAEDRAKVAAAIKTEEKKTSDGKTGSKKTLTLNRPLVAGQERSGSFEGRGRTVKVEVRRRRRGPAGGAAAGQGEEAKTSPSPAKQAAKSLEQRREVEAKTKPAAPTKEPARPTRRERAPTAPSSSQGGGAKKSSSGPRTTIRKGLSPAQIAAARAPKSSLKEIEASIKTDRAEARRSAPAGKRSGAPSGGGTRRSPSVAVAPQPGGAPAGGMPGGGQPRRKGGGGRFQKRRLSPAEKAARRDYESKRHMALTDEEEERMARLAKGKKRKKTIQKDDAEFVVRDVEVPEVILVSELANRMAIKGAEVVKRLFEMGMTVTVNEPVDRDTALLLVEEFGHRAKVINEAAVEDVLQSEVEEDEANLEPRPPVVVVMGHVDHGKTSILDALRKARVAAGEAGGITQHIGAYMVKLEDGHRVVFIDTPGHEAFTSLRARGAHLTDVAVLVVAADDGVKPQTVEALNHARAAGVPIIVAVNKMDKEGADPDMVKRQLAEHELVPEDWGGETIFVPVSAQTGEGLDDLLEMLALQTEILELKANPDRRGRGVVIEARLDRGRGPVATVLVQSGTFKTGDTVVVGAVMGRIRAIVDENSVQHKTAGPSVPFELLGLDEVPEAGQEIAVVENERQARDIVSYRKDQMREMGLQEHKKVNMDELFANLQGEQAKEVPVLIKGDVSGSVDAMAESLSKAGTDQVQVKVVHKGIGGITESDIMLAAASNAIVIGFNVRPGTKAKQLAAQDGVDVRFYKVIYDAIDDIKQAMSGQLAPDQVEKEIGTADVREVFSVPKAGTVAGCFITDGYVTRDSSVRVLRDGVLVYDGKLASLRRFKDDVKEVRNGYECGIGVEKFNDIKPGDTMEFYIIEEVAASL